jgi:hypothetical protein
VAKAVHTFATLREAAEQLDETAELMRLHGEESEDDEYVDPLS